MLVVEDNDELRSEIADLLTQDGYRVLLAADGLMALDLLRREPAVDLVLLDLWMPVMDGWSFRATQRQEAGIKEVPVVVLTADDSPPARSIDADAFLRKPFEADGLSATVRRIVSEKRLGRERSAEEVKKALDLIAGAIGHEVANPLMSLIGWLEQHRRQSDALGPEIDDALTHCWRIADSLRTLRALPFPSLSRSRPVRLGQLVRAVLAGPRNDHLRIEVSMDEQATVRGDPLVLLYVCTTLLHHALESFPRDSEKDGDQAPHVSVSLRTIDGTVVLEVVDRGPAIPADELSQVFSPDYRGRTRGWSAGIRLQYVRHAVEALGGALDITNKSPRGVQSRISLPAAISHDTEPARQSQSPPPSMK